MFISSRTGLSGYNGHRSESAKGTNDCSRNMGVSEHSPLDVEYKVIVPYQTYPSRKSAFILYNVSRLCILQS